MTEQFTEIDIRTIYIEDITRRREDSEDIDHYYSSFLANRISFTSRPFARHLKDGEIFRIYEKC